MINEVEDELFEHHRVVADKGQEPLRVDKFLLNRLEGTSRNRIQQAAVDGYIKVNDKSVKSNYKVKPHDIVTVMFNNPPREVELIPQDIPLDIVYEDEDIVILNKEAGMVVHPGFGNYSGTLVNALAFHFKDLPANGGDLTRPGLVHRIDKNTTGLMVIAKNEATMTSLSKQFYDRTIDRRYNALVWGELKEEEGTIDGHIGRSLKNRKVMTVFPEGEYGKHAKTHYKVLERFGYISLVECKLETGRTHQIRVHFQHIKHPLFNDFEYGGDKILKGTTFTKYKQFVENCFRMIPRQSLHAKSLAFTHPRTKEWMKFDSELPEDMKSVIEKWRNYAIHKI
ncbi:MAG: RluA family pseudouridine synthase [Flavobacteriales bacterium]|jgi:23S rRNA pseudouridine1911/1915/1917 synthase|nr:RNA pseudouridine synthase [Flavobacteriales bacterium]MDG1917498.1 RluA family pseudouridine synthase [Flavobacteriales bacterium]|tara:strand:+ start:32298 stop:33314 length:1017 start_codon:yes stop_codon:yes gene_type:complete